MLNLFILLPTLLLAVVALATPTTPHRARQSQSVYSFYICADETAQGDSRIVTVVSSDQIQCVYADDNGDITNTCNYSLSTGIGDAGCPPLVTEQQPACPTFTCPLALRDGTPLTNGGRGMSLNGVITTDCLYTDQYGDFWNCLYASATGELLVDFGGVCFPVLICPTSTKRWVPLVPREPQTLEDTLEDSVPW
ncbi:hypothetical protein CALCODRAFT_491301 [Calocera cornea HHB12733]|uniref:Uncharacterized protein n=1 Tax=Calocera cornea HHB12733 TaxID=1353952 RepID=A0A165J7I4_9BASI|nr:hypothetical protein CALCODRAFT_491301 [Calocera cornea HHB12733]